MNYALFIIISATLFYTTAIFCLNSDSNFYITESDITNPNKRANYHLKWITYKNDYIISMEKNKKLDADYKWFKYSENSFIDEIYNYQRHYVYKDDIDKTKLFILNYDHYNHEQLSSYEPRAIAFRSRVPFNDADIDDESFYYNQMDLDQEEKDIFTLAYLKLHRIRFEKIGSKSNISCSLVVVIPDNDPQLNEIIYKLLESHIQIKIQFQENYRDRSRKNTNQFYHHNQHHHNSQKANRHRKKHINLNSDSRKKITRRTIKKSMNHRYEKNPAKLEDKPTFSRSFIEVELRDGPVMLHNRFLDYYDFENVTCQLDLIDNDSYSVFKRTIHRVLSNRDQSDPPFNENDMDDFGQTDGLLTTTKRNTITKRPRNQVDSNYRKKVSALRLSLFIINFLFIFY